MATLTIRNLKDSVKFNLRLRAAIHGRSMENEARHILRQALLAETGSGLNLVQRIQARYAAIEGNVELPLNAREPIRQPPEWDG